MARAHRRLSLHQEKLSKKSPASAASGRRRLVAGTLAISGFAASLLTPAQAVTLGEVSLQSALGQPLSARIPVQLGPGEVLGASCISLPTASRTDLSALPRPTISVPEAGGASSVELLVTTTQPLYEPMYELQVQVRCAGTPLLLRQYVLMLDLPGTRQPSADPVPASTPDEQSALPQFPAAAASLMTPGATGSRSNSRPAPPPHSRTASAPPAAPIAAGTRYRVAAGDTLSTIAARINNRHDIWQLADQIFSANPDAFIGGNPDLIKLGSDILIPAASTRSAAGTALSQDAPATLAATAVTAPAVNEPASPAVAAIPPAATAASAPAGTEVPPDSTMTGTDAASTAVFADEQIIESPVGEMTVPVSAPAPQRNGAPPWLAALIGVLIGTALSLALLRDRLLAALGSLVARRKPELEPLASPAASQAPAPRPLPQFSRPPVVVEPSMVVEEHPAVEPDKDLPTEQHETVEPSVTVEQLAAVGPAAGVDLARLFGEEPDLPLFGDPADGLPTAADLDLDLGAAGSDDAVDQDIGWIGDDTALTPTTQSATLADDGGAETVEHIDLQTLTHRASDDPAISQTLKDALNLLESDYEDELTASQVIDRNKLQQLLDEDAADDTFIRTGTDLRPHRR